MTAHVLIKYKLTLTNVYNMVTNTRGIVSLRA